MLATDVSRLTGYRDSYLLFLRNKKLHKVVPTSTERDDLVRREIIPFSNRYRPIGVVSARSVFLQFGQRVIVDRNENRSVLQEPVVITNVQPKATNAIMNHKPQSLGKPSVSNYVVGSQLTSFQQWKTILPCPTSPHRVFEKSMIGDQIVGRPSAVEGSQNLGASIGKSQTLPSIRDLFGNLKGPKMSPLFLTNNWQLNPSTS